MASTACSIRVNSSRLLSPIARIWALLFASAFTLVASTARADVPPSLAADAMFRAGKQHLAAQDYARACLLFAESYRLERATGTLLALAMCHERGGGLDAAQRAYHEVLARSQREGRTDRVDAAREKIGELAELIAVRDAASFETTPAAESESATSEASPAAASATPETTPPPATETADAGKSSTAAPAARGNEANAAPIEVAPSARRPARPRSRASSRSHERPTDEGLSALQWSGIGALGIGGVSLIVASVFTVQALGDKADAKDNCNGDLCNPEGWRQRVDARAAGTNATIAAVIGASAVSAGVILLLLDDDEASARGVTTTGYATRDGFGAQVQGSF